MPVLYGEGFAGAFYRLQVEILQATGDYSLLVWGDTIIHEYAYPGLIMSVNFQIPYGKLGAS